MPVLEPRPSWVRSGPVTYSFHVDRTSTNEARDALRFLDGDMSHTEFVSRYLSDNVTHITEDLMPLDPNLPYPTRYLRNHLDVYTRTQETVVRSDVSFDDIEAHNLIPNSQNDDEKLRYQTVLRSAFNFFRRNHNGRYSDATLMQIARANDAIDSGFPPTQNQLPRIVQVSTPPNFDYVSEVKSGGTVALGIQFPNKSLICVHPLYRRHGLGTWMLTQLDGPAWVSRSNVDGQIFLLKSGWQPSAMNGSGAVRYERGNGSGD